MEGSIVDLSKYRYQSAEEDLTASKTLLNAGQYKASVNRSYYALFHTLRAVTALDGFDSSKHSGIIAFFNRTYVKEGVFDKSLSKFIDLSFRLREKADYQDFVVITKEQAEEQYNKAEQLMLVVKPYLEKQWEKE
ncbi:MAG: HEPN domain-containing protein [Phascolarctobacterium sp.]|nr:HEPN domain-containing protein [Phascolarctobacterium sp.]